MLRILIVDDSDIVRARVSELLSLEGDLQVIGEAADGWQAIEGVKNLQPDVVLMDVNLPALNGIDATRGDRLRLLEQGQAVSRPMAALPRAQRGSPRKNPVQFLSMALEEIGADLEEFGYVLRYGRYALGGRKAEFSVGGLGLAELSRKLGAWLEERGANNFPLQVVDDGSGELTVYVLGEEPT